MKTTVILGASRNPQRFSYKAQRKLLEAGHSILPVNPNEIEIQGVSCFQKIEDIHQPVHSVTIYLNPSHLNTMGDALIKLQPQRVIFNPGSESSLLAQQLNQAGIEVVISCTLIMLDSGDY